MDSFYSTSQGFEGSSKTDNFFDQKVEVSLGGRGVKLESFEELGLPEQLLSNIAKAGLSKPTPTQDAAPSDVSADSCMPRALILAPTRELAIQLYQTTSKFSMRTTCKCEIVYGGVPVEQQKERISKGVQVLVCTLGRLRHFIDEGVISLERVKYLILDEADRLLDFGFAEDIGRILLSGEIAPKTERQTLMFSATFPSSVQNLAEDLLREQFLMIKMGAVNKCIKQDFVEVTKANKKATLLELIGLDLKNHAQNRELEIFNQKTLIFVATKTRADALGVFFAESGIPTTTTHGDREQDQRESALQDFRSGVTPILIATSVAERGLDISSLGHVINFDLPKDFDDYVHRIGRTGRVGKPGVSTSLIDPEEDSDIIAPLVRLLDEAEQPILMWFSEVTSGGSWKEEDAGTNGHGWPLAAMGENVSDDLRRIVQEFTEPPIDRQESMLRGQIEANNAICQYLADSATEMDKNERIVRQTQWNRIARRIGGVYDSVPSFDTVTTRFDELKQNMVKSLFKKDPENPVKTGVPAKQLLEQCEKLEKTEKHLDSIHTTTQQTQRNLNSLKSMFGGFFKKFRGDDDVQVDEEKSESPAMTDSSK